MKNLLESIDQVNGKKLKEKLEEFKNQAIMSKELATIERKAPVEVNLEQIEYDGSDHDKVVVLFKELGFQTLLDKFGDEVPDSEQDQELEDIEYVNSR